MPARSVIEQLPPEAREWLETELLRRGFAGYLEMADEVNQVLRERYGLEVSISKSGLHRFGKSIQEATQTLRRTTDAAKLITKEIGDDEGAMNDVLLRLVQDKLFHIVLALGNTPDDANLYKAGRLIAELGKASVGQKKWQTEMRQRVEKKLTEMEKDAPTLSGPEMLKQIRENVYGMF